MSNLGVIDQPFIDNERWFKQLIEEQQSLTIIKEKEGLSSVSGVIIPLTEKERLPIVVEWLRTCQLNPRLFVWVFSTIILDYEQELLLELGANEVIMEEVRIHRLSLIINNTFQRINGTTKGSTDRVSDVFVNKRNQSVLVNKTEQLLTRSEYLLFNLLYENKETCVPYETLIATIWPNNEKANLYTLANVIFHLRKKVSGSNDFIIQTIRNKGYMFSEKKTR